MLSESHKDIILSKAKKYRLKKVILFRSLPKEISIGVKGIIPWLFFNFCWELYKDLPIIVNIFDLDEICLFNKLLEEDGTVLYVKH